MVTVLTVEVGEKIELLLDTRHVGLPRVMDGREGLSGITDGGVLER